MTWLQAAVVAVVAVAVARASGALWDLHRQRIWR